MNMRTLFFYSFITIGLASLTGCVHKARHLSGFLQANSFLKISIGMPKFEVINEISAPDIVRGSIINKFDQIIEVWEYSVLRNPYSNFPYVESYLLYFFDNKLVQWGRAGDWKEAEAQIYEIRFR
jgi:hypothetical protein